VQVSTYQVCCAGVDLPGVLCRYVLCMCQLARYLMQLETCQVCCTGFYSL